MIDRHPYKTSANHKNTVRVVIYDNFEQLESFQEKWDSFVESVTSDIFLTFDWCRIWWKYYGKKRDLRVFIFRRNNEIVGIIPLFFEKIWLGPIFVRTAKIVGSDSTGDQITIPILTEYIKPVLQSLFELLAEYEWDILHIGPIAGLYQQYDDLKNACEVLLTPRYLIKAENKGVQTYFQLAESWESHLAGLKKKERQLIKSAYRKIDDEKIKLHVEFISDDDFPEKFKEFSNLHESQWRELGKGGHFGDWPHSFEFHCEVAREQLRKNRLRLLEIRLDEVCCAYQYSYRFGKKYFEFLMGRTLSNEFTYIDLGRITFAEQMKRAIGENINWIDSMRGEYEYKLRLGGELFPVRNLYIIPNKLLTLIRVSTFRILARLLHLCYYRIWFCRIAPKLSIKRRHLRQIWIRTNVFS